ncbi:right-handed parallel beta-helix repeat-containing protein [candidate division CSSED10-310 bacterium]|uniref:Right-handed parallel beta-helix repeat-containing protein n=1 Tax=candidate division CSSED10-310 bacterium TaxID=2855610 RepID=A0ABV6YW04_UNCC1
MLNCRLYFLQRLYPLVILFTCCMILNDYSEASTYYVAPSGNDGYTTVQAQNPATPWQTITKAANTMVAGDTVLIRQGTYIEQIELTTSGSSGLYITYQAYPGETATIDGSSISLPDYETGLFVVEDVNYIKVSGLTMMNAGPNMNNCGIYVDNANYIILETNHTINTVSSGIGVWGSTNIIIDGNEVELACNDGEQEDITVAGTDTFEVKNNHVHSGGPGNNGGEGITIKDGSSNGQIFNNHVHDIPNGERTCIYLDAWDKETYNLEVYQNLLHNCCGGISLASENGGTLHDVKIYNNIIYDSYGSGLEIGNWGEPGVTSRPVQNVTFINNTVYYCGYNGWGGGFGNENPDVTNIVVRNNIFSQNSEFQIANESAASLTVDHNLIDGYRDYEFEIYGTDFVEDDPLFESTTLHDFHLQSNSPAINEGSATDAPSDDYDGNARPSGPEYDIGAYEFISTPVPALSFAAILVILGFLSFALPRLKIH